MLSRRAASEASLLDCKQHARAVMNSTKRAGNVNQASWQRYLASVPPGPPLPWGAPAVPPAVSAAAALAVARGPAPASRSLVPFPPPLVPTEPPRRSPWLPPPPAAAAVAAAAR